jgi:putative hemolysin
MEIFIILLLILLNGVFSMSEIALVSARKSKLDTAAKRGDERAKKALETANNPNRFFSTVQIGITLIGILTGIYSGEGLTDSIRVWLETKGMNVEWSNNMATLIVVFVVTYFSLVLGELLPKRIGLINPEGIAKTVAGPMRLLTSITSPFVWLLTFSTDLIIRVFRIKPSSESRVTEEEIKAIIQEGTDVGEIQDIEQDIVERVFNLGDRTVGSIMTHRSETVVMEVNKTIGEVKEIVLREMHSFYPIQREEDDQIIGAIALVDIFKHFSDDQFQLVSCMYQPLYFAENMSAYDALIEFKKQSRHQAIVVNEFGDMEGVVTLIDLLQALVGDVSDFHSESFTFIQRDDHSWLIDGQYPLAEFLAHFELDDYISELPFNTVAGLIIHEVKSIPTTGQKIQWLNLEFEIVDMDLARIDKVICRQVKV